MLEEKFIIMQQIGDSFVKVGHIEYNTYKSAVEDILLLAEGVSTYIVQRVHIYTTKQK